MKREKDTDYLKPFKFSIMNTEADKQTLPVTLFVHNNEYEISEYLGNLKITKIKGQNPNIRLYQDKKPCDTVFIK